ncbi:MAG: glycosyltransferase [Bacteroides sp.]|nr:glycosyltransferase [Bacteroides sp.]
MEVLTINTIGIILISSSCFLFIVQAFYYLGLYNKLYKYNIANSKAKNDIREEYPPLSVIICAKDQAENLRSYLPLILEQDYPKFEVIIINNNSSDESKDILSSLEEKYPHLYHSFTPETARYISHKKLSITLGIKASKYDWVVFTEANCYPVSNNWLKLMARNFTPKTEIVLGYSIYDYAKGWLNKCISFDMLFHSIRYLGFALIRKPYMGIGRNMAYRKELFFKHKGFSAHLNLQRGDDDLFINQVSNGRNTRVETDLQAAICLKHSKTSKEWKEEKINYTATSKHFKGIQRSLLGFETFSRILFYIVTISGIVYSILFKHWLLVGALIIIWALRYIMQATVINKTAKVLGNKRRYYFSLPIFDILQPIQSLTFKINKSIRGNSEFMRK